MPSFPIFFADLLQDPQPQQLSVVASELKRLATAQSDKERAAGGAGRRTPMVSNGSTPALRGLFVAPTAKIYGNHILAD